MNKLDDPKQSAYKKYHSTETLLAKIQNDLILNMKKGEVNLLILLDLSAAFDTIDHNILLNRLEHSYGLNGKSLEWFHSYISNRTQSVVINDVESDKMSLQYGVPQGSKLGPILFNSYIAPLSKIATANGIHDQKYADDEQLLLSFKPDMNGAEAEVTKKMEKCIAEIKDFLHENKLCNNSEKTEFLLIGSKYQLSSPILHRT